MCSILHYYDSSCGKVMFSQVSVSPRVGTPPDRQTPPWAETPWADIPLGQTPPGQTPPWAHTPLGTHPPPEQTPTPGRDPPADSYCSGRYASYWNAFLVHNNFIIF